MARKRNPLTGPVNTTGDVDNSVLLQCPSCGFFNALADWDQMGACEGNVICPDCAAEVDMQTGERAECCGECEFCNE